MRHVRPQAGSFCHQPVSLRSTSSAGRASCAARRPVSAPSRHACPHYSLFKPAVLVSFAGACRLLSICICMRRHVYACACGVPLHLPRQRRNMASAELRPEDRICAHFLGAALHAAWQAPDRRSSAATRRTFCAPRLHLAIPHCYKNLFNTRLKQAACDGALARRSGSDWTS